MTSEVVKNFRLRSFVRRDSRQTAGQARALMASWPSYGLVVADGKLDAEGVFGRKAPLFLEIGFGSGQSLLALAKQHPECDYIGVEPHKPGVGALLLGIEANELSNLRVFQEDVVDVIAHCLQPESLTGISIFFPDPWQKRKHHPRRLVQPAFIKSLLPLLKPKGTIHLATDWEEYAKHMMKVLSGEEGLSNLAGVGEFATRSERRPVLTKFERRAEREGRIVRECQFEKITVA